MNSEMVNPGTPAVSKRVVLLIAIMSSFLTPFTSSSINIALPSIGTKLSMDAVSLNWVATAYLLAAATARPVYYLRQLILINFKESV